MTYNIIKSWNNTRERVKNFFFSDNLIVLLVFLLIIFWDYTSAVKEICESLQTNISIYSFPFIFATSFMRSLILVGGVILFKDAPFLENNCWLMISRMNRRSWGASNILYFILMSILYTLTIHIIMLIGFIGYLAKTDGWGKLIYTLARNNEILVEFGSKIAYLEEIINIYEPLEAMIHSSIILILQLTIIGLIIYTISLISKKKWLGQVMACFYILSEHYLGVLGDPRLSKFMPVTYLDIGGLGTENTFWTISLRTAYVVLLGIIFGLVIISQIKLSKMDIDLIKGDEY